MKGYPISLFVEDLTKVDPELNSEPHRSFNIREALGPKVLEYLEACYGGSSLSIEVCSKVSIEDSIRDLPADILKARLTFDQLAKFKYGQIYTLDRSVEDLFDKEPTHAIVRKIQSSQWRWGMGDKAWNDVVETYNGIRSFDLDLENFEVRLDFTTGHNERGYSRESRTFLDGVFAFLVYYKGEHVMTLGFSVQTGMKLLVQQVQLKNRKGNRFLFKLPSNRLEFFLSRFALAFPNHTLCIADGADIGRTSLKSYEQGREDLLDRIARDRTWEKDPEGELQMWNQKIAHLREDLPRLKAFYAETGRFKRGSDFKVNGITHYYLVA